MTQQEYEQKKRECWEECAAKVAVETTNLLCKAIAYSAFDRAYALGKQEKGTEETKADVTMKARRKSDGEIIEVKEWRGASDVVYSTPDMNQFYQASDLDFNVDAEDTVIHGWVARDLDGEVFLYENNPERGYDEWLGRISSEFDFQQLKWESDPIEVEIIIKRKKK